MTLDQLPHLNAGLNFLAAVLLLVGYGLIRMDLERAHKWTMLAAFATSMAFLVSYCVYHTYISGGKPFVGTGSIRPVYFTILISHVLLAAFVPLLAMMTIYLALTDQRLWHRRLAKWTFPIWLYVSLTGVLIYLFLYIFYPGNPPEWQEEMTNFEARMTNE